MGAMMATLMKKMDKKLQFERASFATDNVRKAAREKRKGKRPAAVEEHEDLYTSSGRTMSDGSHEQDETPTFKFDKIQMGAMMATLMKKMDKKLQFERASFATDNVRKAAREKRKGKRPAAVEEHEDLYTSSGRKSHVRKAAREKKKGQATCSSGRT
ncbi:hypothetical protein HID58_055608 [Brassica napus]|uniref:Uncharacterized protein n=1 Tax=Brassica napus TaxID=3708 RepID=A0ABQ8AKV2_BRANA|nr:hypothetical protein HID58_055608 [Brassica napus]